jgi:FlaA1/EpsC-like NDP-sugar epimerase
LTIDLEFRTLKANILLKPFLSTNNKQKMSKKFEGKVVIVTGGGSGIGRGIALAFSKEGAKIVLASRRLDVLNKVAEEIKAIGTYFGYGMMMIF